MHAWSELHRADVLNYTISLILENYIDGAEFLTLTEAEVKAMIPPIGLARKILKLLPQPEPQVCTSHHCNVSLSLSLVCLLCFFSHLIQICHKLV